ncbi:MAG: hypothetical protein ACP5IE_00195 [Infirmifilum sp.]
MKKLVVSILLLVVVAVATSSMSAPVSITYVLHHFPEQYTSFDTFFAVNGTRFKSGTVTGNNFTVNVDNAYAYLLKINGKNSTVIVSIPIGATTQTVDLDTRMLAQVTFKVTINGEGYKPSAVPYTVVVGNNQGKVTATTQLLFVETPANVTFPATLLFPGVYGYKLTGINGTSTDTVSLTEIGKYTVAVAYDPTGLASLPLGILLVLLAAIVIAVVFAVIKGRSVASVATTINSPFIE